MRQTREVFFVDGVRTAFGKAGPKGQFWRTRADDMAVKVVRELLRRNPEIPPERIGDVVLAATAQVGDQGLTLGRDVALLAGIPETVPGFAVDRMCAGALTAVTAAAGEIALGAVDVAVAGGVEHMGHHPMGDDVDFNPRFVSERLIDESAATMGQTAENLHDLFPAITRERADAFAAQSQRRAAAAWENSGRRLDGARRGAEVPALPVPERASVMRETVVPMAVFTDDGWKVAERDEFLRPDTSLEGLAVLTPAFRAGGRVTAGNSAGLTDGATAAFLAAEDAADELGLAPKLRLVGFAYAGVEPHLMGYGPVPATRRVLEQAGLSLDDVDLFELNEPFAVQVLTWCDELGVAEDDPRLNPYGGAIACGHPLAATGVRLIGQLAYGLREQGGRYGLTALCIGMGMGCAILWERVA
jgi:acetyl-CoA acyltransferase